MNEWCNMVIQGAEQKLVLPGCSIEGGRAEGIPAPQAAISSQCEGPTATGHNGNDTGIMCLEVLLPTVLVYPDPPICQPHPDVGADGCHGCNSKTCFLRHVSKA